MRERRNEDDVPALDTDSNIIFRARALLSALLSAVLSAVLSVMLNLLMQ